MDWVSEVFTMYYKLTHTHSTPFHDTGLGTVAPVDKYCLKNTPFVLSSIAPLD